MGFGEYPAAYNATVHGPYDPARFYGKVDIPFGEVKLGEVGSWLARRSIGGIPGAMSRAFWRWQHKYMLPKKTGFAPFAQLCVGSMIVFYAINYGKIAWEKSQSGPVSGTPDPTSAVSRQRFGAIRARYFNSRPQPHHSPILRNQRHSCSGGLQQMNFEIGEENVLGLLVVLRTTHQPPNTGVTTPAETLVT
ncbi:putative ATP synthase subunit f, mitochondrial [Chionoecetes opilio]|uniref:Putative ATP synthase subunit f, mitochondrial n=1 Tax=Chionoecetes opilio TaxID=41210 RepID=A0A8J4Y381_CHIOP|nr:putative ATP synthase subunit f, mitochondrial [Chionoecetes opilio]